MSARRARDDRGLTIPIVALLLPILVVMVGMAVDLGRQRSDRRLAQAGADVVALDMIRIVEGRTLSEITADPATATALSESAQRNGFDNAVGYVTNVLEPHISNLEWGVIPGDDEDASAFVELDPLDPADADEVPSAVRITAQRTTDYFFQRGRGNVTRVAVATEDKVASFQLGTRLVSVDTASAALLNAVLGNALGGVLNVSVLDYEGLVGTTINLGALSGQLGFGSPEELADATVSAEDFYLAAAQVLADQGDTAAASVFDQAAAVVDSNATLTMGSILAIEQGGEQAAANGSIDAYSILQGSAYAINGSSTLSVPSLSVTIPNVTSTAMTLSVTQPPQVGCCRVGATATTSQATLGLTMNVNVALTPALRIVGTLPVQVVLAGGQGTLSDIDCGQPGISVALAPRPVHTTQTLSLSIRTLLGIEVARADGTAVDVTTQGTSNGASFLYSSEFLPDVGTGTMVPANSTSLGIANAANVTSGNITVLGVLPLGTTVGTIVTALNNLLNPMLTQLDSIVVNQLNSQLGLNVGGADIGAIDMSCRSVKLVG
jgi:uncharacterized membrane protein